MKESEFLLNKISEQGIVDPHLINRAKEFSKSGIKLPFTLAVVSKMDPVNLEAYRVALARKIRLPPSPQSK